MDGPEESFEDEVNDERSLSSPSLASGLRRGDPAAWERFNRLWGRTLLDYCKHRGIGPQDAEEVSQNVLAKIYRGIQRFERDGQKNRLRYWVFDIARKEVHRYRERYLSKPNSPGGSEFLHFAANTPIPESPDESTEIAAFESVLICNILQRIESDFEPHVWKAFWLFVVEGLSGPEVAEKLGMQANGVRQAVYRVKKRIQAEREGLPNSDSDFA